MRAIFEWDDDKAVANMRKHGISFDAAREVFADPFHVVLDNYLVDGEQRLQAIGRVRNLTLTAVIFVDRSVPGINIVHLISARKAIAYEQSTYEDQFD